MDPSARPSMVDGQNWSIKLLNTFGRLRRRSGSALCVALPLLRLRRSPAGQTGGELAQDLRVLGVAEQRESLALDLVHENVGRGRLAVRAELDLVRDTRHVDGRQEGVDRFGGGVTGLDRRDERGRRVV